MIFYLLITSLYLSGKEISQGGLILGKLSMPGQVYLNDKSLNVNKVDSFYVFILGASFLTPPGIHLLRAVSSSFSLEETIYVKKRRFPVQYIKFSKEKRKLFYNKRIKEERKRIKKILNNPSSSFYSICAECVPVHGKITTYYGVERREGKKKLWHHSGIDIGTSFFTPVLAPCRGKIVLSDSFVLPGNLIIIDHGAGLKTVYYHLAKRKVKEGEVVECKDTIGFVGDTGLSTGPHLHFGVYVNGVCVDPIEWVKESKKWKKEFSH